MSNVFISSSVLTTRLSPAVPNIFKSRNVRVNDLLLPYRKGNGKKIVIVVDHTPMFEGPRSRMLDSFDGELLTTITDRAKMMYPSLPSFGTFAWAAINWDYICDPEGVLYNNTRIVSFIKKVSPDIVICFGMKGVRALQEYFGEPHRSCTLLSLLGTPVPLNIDGFSTTLFPSLDIGKMLMSDTGTKSPPSYTLGYVIHNVANAMQGDRIWSAGVTADKVKSVLVDTILKFDLLMSHLREATHIGIDTETDSLNKVSVKLLTIQFAISRNQGFMIPIYHQDTPFSPEELEYIVGELGSLFMTHKGVFVFANTNYDLNVLRVNLRLHHLPFNTWDVQDGEYADDENNGVVPRVAGLPGGYYGLANLAVRYGFYGYVTGDFGKSQRATIKDIPLSTPGLLEYGVYDVVIVYGIYWMQVARARHKKHDQYEVLVGKQLSDTQHVFSTLNNSGAYLNLEYLWWLDSPDSPFNKELIRVEAELFALPEVRIAEGIIRERRGLPKSGLFGKINDRIFDFQTKEHVKVLFFEVLGLEDTSGGKIDDAFQSKYGSHPVVKSYIERLKINNLRGTYVKGFLERVSKDPDSRDHAIRSSYAFRNVVTYRSSSSDPNLQNLPNSPIGKHIKKSFVAPSGQIIIAVDLSAAEVRGLGNISNDDVLAEAFLVGWRLRQEYLEHPTDERRFEQKTKGDVHMVNADFFFEFGLDKIRTVEELAKYKAYRGDVKGLVFGSIYGRSTRSIALAILKEEEYTQKLLDRFYARYFKSGAWLANIVASGRKNLFVEGPNGARRHLWPYLLPETWRYAKSVHSACDRRAKNAPIQGAASMFTYAAIRLLDRVIWRHTKHLEHPPIQIFNQVHDAVYLRVDYEWVFFAISALRHCLTKGTQDLMKRRHGNNIHFPIPMEVEVEVGATWGDLHTFDGRISDLYTDIGKIAEYQRKNLKYDIDAVSACDLVFGRRGEKVPKEFRKQMTNGYFNPTDARNKLVESTLAA